MQSIKRRLVHKVLITSWIDNNRGDLAVLIQHTENNRHSLLYGEEAVEWTEGFEVAELFGGEKRYLDDTLNGRCPIGWDKIEAGEELEDA